MTILGLDFTSEFGSLAIRTQGGTVSEVTVISSVGFAHLIFPAIDEVLRTAGLTLRQIDCFAVSTGPGAFTALRVALAAAKGLAETTGKPLVGLSKLRAVASYGNASRRAVLMDARRGDAFTALFDGELNLLGEETMTNAEDWLVGLGDEAVELLTTDTTWLATVLGVDLLQRIPMVETPRFLAEAVAQCAEHDLRHGDTSDPATLDANYVRRSDAELYWTDN